MFIAFYQHNTDVLLSVQARFMISSMEKWSSKDGSFEIDVFYENIAQVFEEYPNDKFAVETLAWYQRYILVLYVRLSLTCF